MDPQELLEQAYQLITVYGLRLLVALVILGVGRWVAKIVSKTLSKQMIGRDVDVAVSQFAGSLTYALIFAFSLVAALSHIGVETASMIAALGAAGLAVGLALQGSLSNFAAGVLLIVFKPCKVGDYIEAAGTAGVVQDISLLATCLTSPDNKRIVVPNSTIMSGSITNYSAMPTRRIDLVIGISYDSDIARAKAVLEQAVAADERILAEPKPTIGVLELADSSVNLVVRPWVNTSDYWPVRFDLTERIKNQLDSADIGIPFPQVDVHIQQH